MVLMLLCLPCRLPCRSYCEHINVAAKQAVEKLHLMEALQTSLV